jgi:putative DNA primase/helicase
MNNHNLKNESVLQEANRLVHYLLVDGYDFIALHPYENKLNNSIYWRIRLKHPISNKKMILPMHINEDGVYELKEPSFPDKKPIYHQNDILTNPMESIYIVEGEACADALAAFGLVATTSGSWSSAKNADWSLLSSRKIIIWRDNDEQGLKYAINLTQILLTLECTVHWIDIEKLNPPQNGDCVDWLIDHSNATKEDIQGLSLIEPEHFDEEKISSNAQVNYPRFEVKEDGVFYCKDMKDSIRLCSWLMIKALTRNADGINWGRVLEFKDADGVIRRWTMPMELLGGNGDELAKELLRLGLRIAPGNAARRLIVEYITNSDTNERVRCVLSTGWHNNCFVLPHKVFGESQEIILLQSDSVMNTNYRMKGTLKDWQSNVSAYCTGNSRLIFSVALAFAAPLLKITGAESGGFHFRGESSAGKTTTLLIAASVWGGKSFVQNWRATDNALEGLAAQHNDTLLILDELSQIDSKFAGEVAYMLANGQGKARALKSGQTRQRLNWRLLFLSSGEISLASHMQEAGKRVKAGQEVRMVDIPAYAGCEKGIFETLHSFLHGAVFSESLKIACDNYYGTAGDKYLEHLVSMDTLSLHTKIQKLQAEFMQLIPIATHGQVKRVAQRFSLVAAAGELAIEFDITGWQKYEATKAVKLCFDAWLNARDGGIDSQEKDFTLEQVRHFFQENAARFDVFDDAEAYRNKTIPQHCAGFRKSAGDFYVYPKTFRDEVCKGLGSPKEVAKMIEKCGWLLPDGPDKTPYKSVWVPTQSKTIRLYHFSSKVIGES